MTINPALNKATTFWQFKIHSQSEEELEDLTLTLPFEGFYQIEGDPLSTLPASFQKEIRLRPLAPGKDLTLLVWTAQPQDRTDSSQILLNHRYGAIPIRFPSDSHGLLGWLENHKSALGFALFLLFCLWIL